MQLIDDFEREFVYKKALGKRVFTHYFTTFIKASKALF